jgi:outer membrane lipoprotein-sorting protein
MCFSVNNIFALDANALLKKIDENMFPPSYEAYRKVIDEEPNGVRKEFLLYTIKKGRDKVALLYLSPASEKGRSILRIGDDMWLYIPSVNKPIRMTTQQSATGGIFNNSDLMSLDYSVEYNASILEETDKGYIMELKAKTRSVVYDKLKLWALKDSLIVRRIECYSASNMLMKTLEFKKMKDYGNGIVRPSITETHSPLYEGYRSYMIFSEIKMRDFPDEVFTLNYLSKLGDLR